MRLLISEPALALASPLPAGVTPVVFRVGETPGPFDIAFLSRDLNLGGARDTPAPGFAGFVAALAAEPGLQWLHVNSAGVDRPQYKALMARGVRVSTSAGANALGVAQSAVGGVMMLSRGFLGWIDAQSKREWRPATMPFPPDLQGQTATVVGLGPVGNEVGRLLAAIGLKVHGLSRNARDVAWRVARWRVACGSAPRRRGRQAINNVGRRRAANSKALPAEDCKHGL